MIKYLLLTTLAFAASVQASGAETPLTDWSLILVDGQPAGYSATLNLGEPGRVTGQAPCNRYFADLTWNGAAFTLGAIGATKMACVQIAGEAGFFQTLQGIETAEMTAGTLTLSGGGHVMVFVQPLN